MVTIMDVNTYQLYSFTTHTSSLESISQTQITFYRADLQSAT